MPSTTAAAHPDVMFRPLMVNLRARLARPAPLNTSQTTARGIARNRPCRGPSISYHEVPEAGTTCVIPISGDAQGRGKVRCGRRSPNFWTHVVRPGVQDLTESDRHEAPKFFEPVDHDVDLARSGIVFDHQKSLTVRADVVVGNRLCAPKRIPLLKQHARVRQR